MIELISRINFEEAIMKNIMEVAEIIKSTIEKEYAEDISILAYYGSQAMGLADDKSDLDFFFIPKTERGKEAMFQFVIDGIGFDLFPISWERIGKIVALDQPLGAVLTESKVLFSSSESDLNRYESLRALLLNQYKEENQEALLEKAKHYFNDAYIHLFNMENGAHDLNSCHVESSKLLTKIVLSLALINGTYYKQGMGKAIQASYSFAKLPENYKSLCEGIMAASSCDVMIEDGKTLIHGVKTLMNKELLSFAEKEPYQTLFEGYYEEIKSTFNKVLRACDQKDATTAYFRAIAIQEETSLFITKAEEGIWYDNVDHYQWYKKGFEDTFEVDLISYASNKDFDGLSQAIIKLDSSLQNLLKNKGLELALFDDMTAFEKAYKARA